MFVLFLFILQVGIILFFKIMYLNEYHVWISFHNNKGGLKIFVRKGCSGSDGAKSKPSVSELQLHGFELLTLPGPQISYLRNNRCNISAYFIGLLWGLNNSNRVFLGFFLLVIGLMNVIMMITIIIIN